MPHSGLEIENKKTKMENKNCWPPKNLVLPPLPHTYSGRMCRFAPFFILIFLFSIFSPKCGIAQLSLSLFVFEWVYLNDLHICISRLCIKMSSFLYMCTHAQCRVTSIHHVEFYFRFQHLITLPVYSQLWDSSQGQ